MSNLVTRPEPHLWWRLLPALDGRGVLATLAAVLSYVGAFVLLQPTIGATAGVLSIVPVVIAGVLLGFVPGVVVGAAAVLLTWTLWWQTGAVPGETFLRVGSGYGLAIAIVIGGIVGYMRDARETLREERARLSEALADREYTMRLVARELTNPLVAIARASRVLAGDAGAVVDVRASLGEMADEAEAGLELLKGLTDSAAFEAHGVRLARGRVDLVALARRTLERFNAGGRTIELHVPDGPVPVEGDEGALEVVLRHLLGNALLYAPHGRILLEVRIVRGHGEVSVRDHGPGIHGAERASLFQKFARLSTAGGTRGAGLGLYISRAIVDEHGSALRHESPREGGSRFSFRLPLRR